MIGDGITIALVGILLGEAAIAVSYTHLHRHCIPASAAAYPSRISALPIPRSAPQYGGTVPVSYTHLSCAEEKPDQHQSGHRGEDPVHVRQGHDHVGYRDPYSGDLRLSLIHIWN